MKDAIDKKITFNTGFARDTYRHMDAYEKFLHSIGIAFEWSVDKDTKQLSYRDLTGTEKILVFQKINIKAIIYKLKIFGNVLLTYLVNSKLITAPTMKCTTSEKMLRSELRSFFTYTRQVMSHLICMLSEHMCPSSCNYTKTFPSLISMDFKNITIRHLRTTFDQQTIVE